jgi:hypothetical protein
MSELGVPVIQMLPVMAQGQKHCRTQDCLWDEEIVADLYSDNLSDVPDNIFSLRECEIDRECKIKCLLSDSEKTSDESDD